MVVKLAFALGFQILTVPSQLLERNVSLEMRFQCTEKTSRACSCHDCTGNWERVMSNSFTEPSPPAVRIWFSCASDQAVSKSESCVSNLDSNHSSVSGRWHVMYESCNCVQRNHKGIPFLCDYAARCQTENVDSTVAYEPKVCRCSDGDARVEERRVLDAVPVVALGAEFKHRGDVFEETTRRVRSDPMAHGRKGTDATPWFAQC